MQKSQRTSQHGTQHVQADNRTTQNTKQMSITDPTKQLGVNSCAREGQADPASYQTPVVLLIYTVKSDKGIGNDRVKKYLRKK